MTGFLVRPWFRNISSAIRKEPKWFLRDWSTIADSGQRFETMIAAHLLKAVEGWTDLGFGSFALHYLRNKQKQEVDFMVTRDEKPWFQRAGDLAGCATATPWPGKLRADPIRQKTDAHMVAKTLGLIV